MQEAQRKLIEQFIAAYNGFDVAGMLSLLGPDIRFENYSGGRLDTATDGIDQFRELAERSKAMFSEREQRVVSVSGNDRTATVEIVYWGRLAVDVPNGPAAGTVIELSGHSEYSVRDGRIVKIVDRS